MLRIRAKELLAWALLAGCVGVFDPEQAKQNVAEQAASDNARAAGREHGRLMSPGIMRPRVATQHPRR
jgi:hypothetical protein